ncbi:uncharacterized protein PITG_20615 [Phytophthora infestans T30-4]|uniref:glucan endo-1,3-beta-D-glucosidase n=1 Tax=Phytophthora infestans (strain T30-4) TaxID=403677 RepID=D0P2D6_PHYIT|nr:uncharacterized protein PITG_20615 [Phytophthora infestans T30-4]EEY55896.1 conserved hypothetical protein [Phytophthora infestans T30-4]|eukprot:XP_002895530.1 conserved hypothetical protein [Phytophthora infestans T30-4]
MKLYGMFLMAGAMVSAVSAGAGKICDMDPVVTPAPATPVTDAPVPQTDEPATPATVAPVTEAPVTQVDTPQQQGSEVAVDGRHGLELLLVHGRELRTYEQVTDIASCIKTPVTTSNPVSPLDSGVTLALRGPMTISGIGVFINTNGTWAKVSSYENGGAATNMVFLNNENIDYTGGGSPEGFCEADGTGVAKQSTPFSGTLAAASNPGGGSIVASEATGAEVHIMTENKCGVDVECEGAYDKDGTAYQGWTGGKKIFVFKVSMADGGAPNVPAAWLLPDQVTHSGQYGCNCRGKGPAGGCGELDIVEVLEKDTSYVATHFYFYKGKYNPGNDQFAKRPTDGPATYVTIIDEDYGVKVIQIGADDFDFSCGSITNDVVSQWEAAE